MTEYNSKDQKPKGPTAGTGMVTHGPVTKGDPIPKRTTFPTSPKKILDTFGKVLDYTMKLGHRLAVLLARCSLAAMILTGFAKKETEQSADGEPPKTTLTAGTLGMKVLKVKINGGNRETDFDANMMYAQAAKEVVGKLMTEKEQDHLFKSEPIKGAVKGLKSRLGKATQNLHKSEPLRDADPSLKRTPIPNRGGRD